MSVQTTFNYVAPSPGALIREAVFEGTALKYFNLLPNVRNKTELTTLVGVPTIQGSSCVFDPQSGRDLTPRELDVKTLNYSDSICEDVAFKLVQSQSEDLISSELGEFLAADLLAKLNRTIDSRVFISVGGTAAPVETDGIYTLAKADGDTKKDTSAGATAGATAGNIITLYNAFYAQAPAGVQSEAHVTFMPMSDVILLGQAALLTNGGQRIVEMNASGERFYTVNPLNIIVPVNGLASGQWLLTSRRNLWAATDLSAASIQVAKTAVLDDQIGMKAKFTYGVNYGISSDVLVR